jgi:hypothetical protein
MVGARGFEPPTPWSRTRCATRLRYAPNNCCGGLSIGCFPCGSSVRVGLLDRCFDFVSLADLCAGWVVEGGLSGAKEEWILRFVKGDNKKGKGKKQVPPFDFAHDRLFGG